MVTQPALMVQRSNKEEERSKIVKNIADANKSKNKFKLQTIKMCICNSPEGEESPKNTKKIYMKYMHDLQGNKEELLNGYLIQIILSEI